MKLSKKELRKLIMEQLLIENIPDSPSKPLTRQQRLKLPNLSDTRNNKHIKKNKKSGRKTFYRNAR